MRIAFCIINFCFLIAISVIPALADQKRISISADRWFPFNGDPTSERPGYMVEVAKKIFEAKGYQIDYKITPWSRSVSDLERGTVDGIVGAAKGDAPDAIFPEESLGMGGDSIFTLASSSWTYLNLDSLKSIALGSIADYSYSEALDAYISAHKNDPKLVQEIGGDTALQQNIKKLQLGRIDAVVDVPVVFWTTVDEMKLARALFRDAGGASEADPIYIAFSPKNPKSKEYAQILSDGIRELRESGELNRILERYNLQDWK